MKIINKVNNHIKTLSYAEYATSESIGSNYIDLRHGLVNYTEISEKFNNLFDNINKNQIISYHYSQDSELLKKISIEEQISTDNIILTDGADSALHHIAETFLSIGKLAFVTVPSFPRTEFHAQVTGSRVRFINLYSKQNQKSLLKLSLNIKKYDPDVVFLESPNNPTGQILDVNETTQLFINHKNTVFVIDQSLSGYSEDSLSSSTLKHHNLIIVKSFSKLVGLPGLRIGYMVTSKKLFRYIRKVISPYELSTFSILMAREFINNKDLINFRKKQVANSYKLISKKLKIKFSNSKGPFVIIDGTDKIQNLHEQLREKKILTVNGRNFRGLERSNTIRVSLTHYQNIEKLIDNINSL